MRHNSLSIEERIHVILQVTGRPTSVYTILTRLQDPEHARLRAAEDAACRAVDEARKLAIDVRAALAQALRQARMLRHAAEESLVIDVLYPMQGEGLIQEGPDGLWEVSHHG